MADSASGWQTVLPTTHSRVDRLDRAQLDAYERQALESWAKIDGDWSGSGKHTTDVAEAKKLHAKLKTAIVQTLGRGGQGEVQKLNYTHRNRSVVLARKRLRGVVDDLREEANILERLCHDHIVRLIGTYGYHHRELYLLLWPAATRDLASLLNDLDDLRFDGGDRADILERLADLELHDVSAIDHPYADRNSDARLTGGCPLDYLRRSMGCLTGALQYCHDSGVRHLDLKPENILVSPGQVHLADFGISRDVKDQEHTMTYLEIGTKKWFAPERFSSSNGWSMKSGGDVYSLGLVFLNIAAIMYGARQSTLFEILKQIDWKVKLEQFYAYLERLQTLALVTQEFADETAHTVAPKHIVGLIRRMTAINPEGRPDTTKVNEELSRLGGLEQIYHNPCCKVSPRTLTQLLDNNFARICSERDRLAAENERISKRFHTLEAAEETYKMRLDNQQQKHARDWATMSKQLEDAKQANQQLEAQLQQHSRRHRPGMPSHDRSSNGLTMKNTRQHPKSPNQHHSKPVVVPMVNAVQVPRPVSPTAVRRLSRPAAPEMTKSTDSLHNYPLRSRASGSRLPQPINPSTPIRSETPGTPRDPNLTDSTMDSMTSSIFSRFSRRTTSTGLSPNPGPNASRLPSGVDHERINQREPMQPGVMFGTVGLGLAPDTTSQMLESEILHEITSQHGDSVQDTASQAGTENSEFGKPMRVPSLPVAKSWAKVAGDHSERANMMAATGSGRNKRKT